MPDFVSLLRRRVVLMVPPVKEAIEKDWQRIRSVSLALRKRFAFEADQVFGSSENMLIAEALRQKSVSLDWDPRLDPGSGLTPAEVREVLDQYANNATDSLILVDEQWVKMALGALGKEPSLFSGLPGSLVILTFDYRTGTNTYEFALLELHDPIIAPLTAPASKSSER